MIRDLARLVDGDVDVLVVGGGIYGLTIAYDAAQRGLTVALVERGDFGHATSFNHLKTIHGGLRYLQSGDLRRMRESILERRTFARIAPRFVEPLVFAMPLGTSLARSALGMGAAFAVDAAIGFDRNRNVAATRRLPAGRVVGSRTCRQLFDGAIEHVRSAAVWYDYQTVHGDKLTLAFAKAAYKHGAVLANHAEAIGVVLPSGGRSGQRLVSVTVRDLFSGSDLEIRARVLVNAAGPWSARVLDALGIQARWPLMKAMNLVTRRPAPAAALAVPTRAGRALVMLPWQGRTLIGTSESSEERHADDQAASRIEVQEFIAEINETFPSLGMKLDEVTLVHRGVVPAARHARGLSLMSRHRILNHRDAKAPEVFTVIGVKYTTARLVAEQTVDQVMTRLGRRRVACRTADVVLPGASLEDGDPADAVAHAIKDEMAYTLLDVVVRRTGMGSAGHPGEAVAADVADKMQRALGWSDERKALELATLKDFYRMV